MQTFTPYNEKTFNLTHAHNRSLTFVHDYRVDRYQKKTFTHSHPSCSTDILYQLPPSTTIYSILCVEITCLTFHSDNLSPGPLWSSYSMQFFTQSSIHHYFFHNTCPYHLSLFCCSTKSYQFLISLSAPYFEIRLLP